METFLTSNAVILQPLQPQTSGHFLFQPLDSVYVLKNENRNHTHDVSPVMFRIAYSIPGTYSDFTSENSSRRLKMKRGAASVNVPSSSAVVFSTLDYKGHEISLTSTDQKGAILLLRKLNSPVSLC